MKNWLIGELGDLVIGSRTSTKFQFEYIFLLEFGAWFLKFLLTARDWHSK